MNRYKRPQKEIVSHPFVTVNFKEIAIYIKRYRKMQIRAVLRSIG